MSDADPAKRDDVDPAAPRRARRRWWLWAAIAAVVAVLAGIGLAVYYLSDPGRRQLVLSTGPAYPYSTPAERTPDRLRVLFLGNSFTQFNGGIALALRELTASAHKTPAPVFDQVTKFGATWAELWSQTPARDVIRQGNWDYVVLQDYSRAAMIYRTEMDQYGKTFTDAIRGVGAKPLFFMTWARKDEPRTQRLITGAYAAVAAANHAAVVPAGVAWEASLHGRPRLTLHTADKKHPTPAGTYLNACVFYAVLYHESPHGLTGRISDGTTPYIVLDAADATYLQDVAWATVRQVGRVAATQAATRPASRPTTAPTLPLAGRSST